jgi:hypothetical protein
MEDSMTDYNDGEWHIWKGGECPVHPESVVEIRLRVAGEGFDGQERQASELVWVHDHDSEVDIICFRVVKAHREPRVWWVNEYDGEDVGPWLYDTKTEAAEATDFRRRLTRVFKVQEVIE